MQVEILDPRGVVSYRRPHRHPDVAEALATEGYSVLFPGCADMSLLEEIGCRDGVAYPVSFTRHGMLVDAVNCGRHHYDLGKKSQKNFTSEVINERELN